MKAFACASLVVLAACSSVAPSSNSSIVPSARRVAQSPGAAPACIQPIQTVTEGISKPRAIIFDSDQDLIVANTESNRLTVYPPGKASPAQIISEGISHPTALAFDASGDLYVANRGN